MISTMTMHGFKSQAKKTLQTQEEPSMIDKTLKEGAKSSAMPFHRQITGGSLANNSTMQKRQMASGNSFYNSAQQQKI